MVRSLLCFVIVAFLLIGFQHGAFGNKDPQKRQSAVQLPDGSILVPYGQSPATGPQYSPGYSPLFVPDPYFSQPVYPDAYYPDYSYQPTPTKPDFSRLLFLLFFLRAFNPTATVATTTASTFPGTCQWGPWSTCSTICRGTRTRTKKCAGITTPGSEMCNTETGFRSDGNWYRASNCYEYFWSTTSVTSKTLAEAACNDFGTRLASTGLRNDTVRTNIVTRFVVSKGIGSLFNAFVGISNEADVATYVWTDGFKGYPKFWRAGEPSGTATACIVLEKGNSFGLFDEACGPSAYSYLCERLAQ